MSALAATTLPAGEADAPPRRRLITRGLLLFAATFALFAVTAGPLVGYEPETAAVSQGIVKSGAPRILPGNGLPAGSNGTLGRHGLRYGRAGLTQPVLEVPLYWVGEQIEHLGGGGYRAQAVALDLFEPAMAALTVLAIFGLLLLRGVTESRALLVAGLCAIGTMIWPYSKIGMDTVSMCMLALTALAVAWAGRRPSPGRFALVGCALALTMNAKGYVALFALGLLPLILPRWWALRPRERLLTLTALAVPALLGVAVVGWYNWYRTGSVTNFGDPFVTQRLLAMPFAAVGLLISPGKGLVFYSPLVVLGALGLRDLRAADRPLARAIVLTVAINVVFISTSLAWTDETWGPRYLIESAWLLVIPIAWWLTGRRRLRWLAIVSTLAVAVQFVGVFCSYGVVIPAERVLSGEPTYLYGTTGPVHVAFGDDGPRWIPQASPLLFQTELTVSYLKEKLTGTGFEVDYAPWRAGANSVLDLRHPEYTYGPLPDFWWTLPDRTATEELVAGLLAAFGLLCSAALLRAVHPRSRS